MLIIHTIKELRELVSSHRSKGETIAFVPTMGNLHEGHLSLIDEARKHAQCIISSIFVNPMQFGENEDLDAYPRTIQADSEGLAKRGCHILFAPKVQEVYPGGLSTETRVDVPALGQYHCGASRPGHFVGVATVVSKLFNMVQPDIAIFGEKDFQQLAVIRKMAKDLCMPINIIGVPTSREPSGLARSSRNGYLSQSELETASQVYQVLKQCKEQLQEKMKDLNSISQQAKQQLKNAGFYPDYVNIAKPSTLEPSEPNDHEFVVLLAARLGKTRLIDNIVVNTES
jgi:pantoate--beta-alanine ligase